MEAKKRCFKTWLVESAVSLWGAVSFTCMLFVTDENGAPDFRMFIPSVVSLLLSVWVFIALTKRGYFPEAGERLKKSGGLDGR